MVENMEIHHDLQWHKCHRLLSGKKKNTPVSFKELIEITGETMLKFIS